MSVYKRKNSKNWYMRFEHKGKLYDQSTKTTRKDLAEQAERRLRLEVETNGITGNDKATCTLSKAIDLFLEEPREASTSRSYYNFSKNILNFYGSKKKLEDLSTRDVADFVSHLRKTKHAPSTISLHLTVVRGGYNKARSLEYRTKEVIWPVIKIKNTRLRFLTIDEERRLLKALSPNRDFKLPLLANQPANFVAEAIERLRRSAKDVYDLVVILLDTGARKGEILNLKWEHVDLDNRCIHLWRNKTSNESVIPMTDRAFDTFEDRQADPERSNWVFPNRNGDGPRAKADAAFRTGCKVANIKDFRMHDLRHTYASRLIQNGLGIHEVKEMLGHSNIQTTMRYAHLDKAATMKRAATVLSAFSAKNGFTKDHRQAVEKFQDSKVVHLNRARAR